MNTYELTIILHPEITADTQKKELAKLSDLVKEHEGSILKTDEWGSRELAYPIQKKKFGKYIHFVLQANEQFTDVMERNFNINDNILRYLLVLKDKHAPDLSEKARENLKESEAFGKRDNFQQKRPARSFEEGNPGQTTQA